MDEGAVGAVAWEDIGGVGVATGEGEGFDVEAIGGFLFIGAVAFEAGLLEDRLDVLYKIHGLSGRGGQVGGGGAEGSGEEEDGESEHAMGISWGRIAAAGERWGAPGEGTGEGGTKRIRFASGFFVTATRERSRGSGAAGLGGAWRAGREAGRA